MASLNQIARQLAQPKSDIIQMPMRGYAEKAETLDAGERSRLLAILERLAS